MGEKVEPVDIAKVLEGIGVKSIRTVDPQNLAQSVEAVKSAMERTKDNSGLKLNIALNYGGRAELALAAKKLAEKVAAGEIKAEEINEAAVEGMLYTAGIPDVDLLIRTSGEMRTSNFLPWQTAYAEMIFDTVNWPEFDRARYLKCLRTYAERDRRFGGVKTPVLNVESTPAPAAPETKDEPTPEKEETKVD